MMPYLTFKLACITFKRAFILADTCPGRIMQKLHKPLSQCISGLADELVAKRHDDAMAQCDLLGRKKEKENVSWKGVSSNRADLIKTASLISSKANPGSTSAQLTALHPQCQTTIDMHSSAGAVPSQRESSSASLKICDS